MKKAKAFAPAAISSFFEICDANAHGKSIADLERIGARGGGFGLQKGVLTEISISEVKAKTNNIKVFINSKFASEAKTTKTVLQMLLNETDKTYDIIVNHKVEVPIGAGFGTSAGGALTAALALKEALALPLTYNQIGKAAHVAEIKCQTGLGTVSSLASSGGCVLVVEPGAPGICIIDRIPLTPNYVIVAGVFGTMPKRQILSSFEKRREINIWGKKTLEAILDEPLVENFLACCLEFADKAGFMTERIRQLVRLAQKAGAVGVAQNMLGEAVHALVLEENAQNVVEAFKQVLPIDKIVTSKIDFQGARLI